MNSNIWVLCILSIFSLLFQISLQQATQKCLVCKQVAIEITSAINNEDPKKTIETGSFRIQPDGSQKQSKIKYAGSSIHLYEVLENLCETFDNFAQAEHKETGELILMNLSKGLSADYNLIPSVDLNRSLKYHCETIVEDHEDDILHLFKSNADISSDTLVKKLCSDVGDYCAHQHKEL